MALRWSLIACLVGCFGRDCPSPTTPAPGKSLESVGGELVRQLSPDSSDVLVNRESLLVVAYVDEPGQGNVFLVDDVVRGGLPEEEQVDDRTSERVTRYLAHGKWYAMKPGTPDGDRWVAAGLRVSWTIDGTATFELDGMLHYARFVPEYLGERRCTDPHIALERVAYDPTSQLVFLDFATGEDKDCRWPRHAFAYQLPFRKRAALPKF